MIPLNIGHADPIRRFECGIYIHMWYTSVEQGRAAQASLDAMQVRRAQLNLKLGLPPNQAGWDSLSFL